jgi:CrcB protein
MTLLLLVAVAGGLGAVARFVLDGMVKDLAHVRYPLSTAVVNLTGSLLLGLVLGLTLAQTLPERWLVLLGTGFLGGYTTFSTASVETVRLVQERRAALALAYAFGMLLASVVLAGAGLWLGLGLGSA